MKNKKLILILKEFAVFLLQIIFSKIYFFDFFSPVGIAFALSRISLGNNVALVTAEYFISRWFLFGDFSLILITAFHIAILALFYFSIEFIKTNKKILMTFTFVVLANMLDLYFCLQSFELIVKFLINFIFQTLFVFYFLKLYKAYKNKLIFFKFSHGDYVVFSIFAFLLSLGIFSYTYNIFCLEIFILAFVLLISSKILPAEKYFIFTLVFSLGSVAICQNYFYLIFSSICSIFFIEIQSLSKWVASLSSLCLMFLIFVLFKIFYISVYISLFLVVILFLAIPDKIYVFLSKSFSIDASTLIYNYLDEQKTENIKKKLLLLSKALLSMEHEFKFLMVGKISHEKASESLSEDIINRCCSGCENFKTCFYGNINKKSLLEGLMLKAIDIGQVEEYDFPSGLQAYCSKSSIMISEINQISKQFAKYEVAIKNEDTSKLIVANELKNFSDIFVNFSSIFSKNSIINFSLSKSIKENLINAMIDVKEVVVTENELGILNINIIALNEQILKKDVIDVLQKRSKVKMKLKSVKHIEIAGLSLATFEPITKIGVEFAISSKSKEKDNGDNTLVTKLSDGKYFVAIADGMGHGESANRISKVVLSLIKSLFEVGLDENLILQTINKLLLPAGLENFTTLDACVIDPVREECTFIKLGSSVSVIKRKNTSEVVSCNSLPIGIVQSLKPTIIKKNIQVGDMIFLASDGVVDSFTNIENYKCFINDAKIFNVQKFLDDIIIDSENFGTHPDDMTVLAVNLLKNY